MQGLLIDTSADPAILGLIDGKKILKQEEFSHPKKLSTILFPALEKFCSIDILDYIAVGVGPGSFIGIRTAATIAKTLSFAKNLPVIEFPSPLAFLPKQIEGSFAIFGDAKMGQYYFISGIIEKENFSDISSPLLISPEDLAIHLSNKNFITGPGYLSPKPYLTYLANLCETRYLQGLFADPSTLELNYLRCIHSGSRISF